MSRRNRHIQHRQPHGAQPIAAEFVPDWTPTYGLDRQIAQARRDMGEAEWQRLNAEFECAQTSPQTLPPNSIRETK